MYYNIQSASYGNLTVDSFSLRGQWGYRARKIGSWKRASYITRIGGHTVELELRESLKHRGENQYGVRFRVDGSEAEVSAAKGKPGIARWLLGVWKQVLKDYPDATFTCVPYAKDGGKATRERWYTKLGFRWNSDNSVLFYLS